MIVLFGSSGQLGNALCRKIGEGPEHLFLCRQSENYCGDVTNIQGITETLMELKPEIIINASGYTAVERAENNIIEAESINITAPSAMAQISAEIDAIFVHYSTDYVFDGLTTRPYTETDVCNPLSVYGKTKFQGEKAIAASGARHFIIRTSWLYSSYGKNFLKTILRLSTERDELSVINDQWGVPTHVDLVANVTIDLVNMTKPDLESVKPTPPWGIYHCTADGKTTWFEYASLILQTAETQGFKQKIKKLEAVSTDVYSSAARRPKNSQLDTTKLRKILDSQFPDWKKDVSLTVNEVISKGSSI